MILMNKFIYLFFFIFNGCHSVLLMYSNCAFHTFVDRFILQFSFRGYSFRFMVLITFQQHNYCNGVLLINMENAIKFDINSLATGIERVKMKIIYYRRAHLLFKFNNTYTYIYIYAFGGIIVCILLMNSHLVLIKTLNVIYS